MIFGIFTKFYAAVPLLLLVTAFVFISADCGRKNVEPMPPKQSLEISQPTKMPPTSNRENQNMNQSKTTKVTPDNWGATGIAVAVEENGVKIEFDCAVGEIKDRLTVDENGEFYADGTFTRESFGPIRVNNPPKSQPARYEGKISGDTMTLNVRLIDKKEKIGDFTLERGKFARLHKCQ